jgi:hypothetical protein
MCRVPSIGKCDDQLAHATQKSLKLPWNIPELSAQACDAKKHMTETAQQELPSYTAGWLPVH